MMRSVPNILIPMAGAGSRFESSGYSLPKPFIDVNGKPMAQVVIENLNIDGKFIFVIQKKDAEIHGLEKFLHKTKIGCVVLKIDSLTEGPACTALLAKQHITEDPLVIINCDQVIRDFDFSKLLEFSEVREADGILGAFISSSDKNSYMKLDPHGKVTEIREKIVISNVATNGLHFWKNGRDFVDSAEEMISQYERYRNEFYIAPTFNHLIKKGKTILPYFYNLHMPIGTPEDLKIYTDLYGNI